MYIISESNQDPHLKQATPKLHRRHARVSARFELEKINKEKKYLKIYININMEPPRKLAADKLTERVALYHSPNEQHKSKPILPRGRAEIVFIYLLKNYLACVAESLCLRGWAQGSCLLLNTSKKLHCKRASCQRLLAHRSA